MRPAQLRRLLAAGKISPAEIADYEKQVAVRQERRAGEMEAWLDKIADNRHDPIYVGMMWGTAWQVVDALRPRGIKDGDFHPDTIFSVGGGTKGEQLTDDYKAQIVRFFILTSVSDPISTDLVIMIDYIDL